VLVERPPENELLAKETIVESDLGADHGGKVLGSGLTRSEDRLAKTVA
jgi:hypothetical protein